jgi:general secretion pathway protein D
MPPAQPVPSPAPPASTPPPPVEIKPSDFKGEIPGQPVPPPEETKPPEDKEEVPVRPAPPRPEGKPADVSFFFDDADVYEVIQTIFGEVLKVNYIVDPKIRGRVNFRTTAPIPKDQVLSVMEIILRLNGIAVVEEQGLYRIIAITDIPKEPAPIRFGRDPNAVQ